eukprot:3868391-Prorocentrum_lima.AAC.1
MEAHWVGSVRAQVAKCKIKKISVEEMLVSKKSGHRDGGMSCHVANHHTGHKRKTMSCPKRVTRP